MLTNKQKKCSYCNFPADCRGWDFGKDDNWFQVCHSDNGFHIEACGGNRDDVVKMYSVDIDYCPMCGRKLEKENNQ